MIKESAESILTESTLVERALVQKRVLRVLTAGQVVGSAALGAAVTVGAFVVQDILGQETPWAGVSTATVTVGTAFSAQAFARLMRRKGRRSGLVLGYALAVLGAVVAAVGAEKHFLSVFLVGLFLYGSGQASNLLARYAAADLATPDERSQAISRVVFASTFGAVAGPLLLGPAENIGHDWFGLGLYTGPWLLAALAFFLAMVNTAWRLRPDPLVMAGGVVTGEVKNANSQRLHESLRVILGSQRARLALWAMVASHMTMVGVMTMTPVHLKLHGHEGVSHYVVAIHIAGMYALSPLVGRYADRRGRAQAIRLGGIYLMMATMLAGLSGDTEQLLFPSLWLLGIGWNFGLIGGSSLLTESVPQEKRVAVQGAADLTMSFCGGLAGFSSGFIREAFGFHLLAQGATVVASSLLVAAFIFIFSQRSSAALPTH